MNARWSRIRPIMLRAARGVGTRDGAVAALAVLASLAAAWIALIAVPAERRVVDVESRAAASERRAVLRMTRAGQKDAGPLDASTAFIAEFPSAQSRPERVARLIALAQQHGLSWKRSEYAYAVDPALALSRYQLAMPLSGSYESVRVFIAEALVQDDALALDSVRLHRTDSRSTEVQVELRFTLFARADASDARLPAEDAR